MRLSAPALLLAAALSSSPSASSAFHVSRPAESVKAAQPSVATSGAFLPQQQQATTTTRQTGSASSARSSSTTALAASGTQKRTGGGGGPGDDQGGPGGPGEDEYQIPVEPGTHDELMYALGINLARQIGDVRPLVENGEELSQVARGLLDSVVGRLDERGQERVLQSRGQDLDEIIVERANKIRQRMEATGKAMLENMAETPNVIKLDSGVLIDVVEPGPDGPGQGTRPTAASSVEVDYHGTLPDGTVFDSTIGMEPATFALGQVIPGWKDALLNIHEGETAVIGIPPDMGYGPQGTPDGRIPGGATLFFKINLIKVLSAGIGGSVKLLGSDGQTLGGGGSNEGSGLLGLDGKPMGPML